METEKNPFSLIGKNIIITGASSGIGRYCALVCSKMGARVILFGRKADKLRETLEAMRDKDKHLLYPVDLNDFVLTEDCLRDAVEKTGGINGLINCAGVTSTYPFNMVKPERLDEMFKINVFASINLTRLVVKKAVVSEEGASIVFIGSVMGVVGENGKSAYSMTKGALIAGAKSLAIELAPKKIRVNSVSPGVVVTPMTENEIYYKNEDALNRIKSLHPLGLGQPEDVANACVYLLSDASRWVTGINLILDGGYTAW